MKRAILHSKNLVVIKNVCIFANIKMQEIPAASLLNDMLFLVFITKSRRDDGARFSNTYHSGLSGALFYTLKIAYINFMMYLCSEAYCKIPSQPKRLGSRFVWHPHHNTYTAPSFFSNLSLSFASISSMKKCHFVFAQQPVE